MFNSFRVIKLGLLWLLRTYGLPDLDMFNSFKDMKRHSIEISFLKVTTQIVFIEKFKFERNFRKISTPPYQICFHVYTKQISK